MKRLSYFILTLFLVFGSGISENYAMDVWADKSPSGKAPRIGSRVRKMKLSITPFAELNAGGSRLADHADLEKRSFLVPVLSSETSYNNDASNGKPPTYARIKRLPDGKYMLLWQRGAENRKDGNGKDTYYAIGSDIDDFHFMGCLFEHKTVPGCRTASVTRYYTCPELITLSNGDLLAVNSFWTASTYNREDCKGDHGIVIKRSADIGLTWTEEQVIATEQCWEPFLLEMPDGEIHCYFTEAHPWISSSNSGTVLVLSKDGGRTWEPQVGDEPYRVMRKKWYHEAAGIYKYTNQMPVGIRLCGTGRLAFAMEDVDAVDPKVFHSISIVYSPGDPGWTYLQGDETGPSTREDKLGLDACAPYLVQFPSGESVLSYSREKGNWPYCYRIGNASATNFTEEQVAMPKAGNWTGTTIDGDHSMLIASPYSNAIHICRYALNHDICATCRTVRVDADNSEWAKTDEALYFSNDEAQDMTLRCSCDDNNIFFLVETTDPDITASDHVSIFVGPSSEEGLLSQGSVRVTVSPGGVVETAVFAESWEPKGLNVNVSTAYDGTLKNNGDADHGWISEISIPRAALPCRCGQITISASFRNDASKGVICTCPSSNN